MNIFGNDLAEGVSSDHKPLTEVWVIRKEEFCFW